MVKEILYASVFAILLTSLFANLYSIAKETSDKTVVFADDMKNAIECATRGISIYYCSPNLASSKQFEEELDKTNHLLNSTIKDMKRYNTEFKDKLNITVIPEEDEYLFDGY